MRRLLVLAILLLATPSLGCKRGQAVHEPDWSLNRMLEQPRYDPLGEGRFFADGAAMREPPKGTLAISQKPWDTATQTGFTKGAPLDAIPLKVDRALLSRGRDKFEIVCATCHGVIGDGDSPVARNMPLRKPRSLHDDEIRNKKPGEIFGVITNGFGLMPSFAPYLTPEDRWAVIAYVRALQLSQRAEVAKLPPDVKSQLEATP